MKSFVRSLYVFTLLIVIAPLGWSQADVITILHLNDTHSNLASIGPRTENLQGTLGGIARAATVINRERLANRHTLVLHAGDLFVGDLFFNVYFGVPELKMLNLLGCDAMAVGNHEFDLTPAVLQQTLDQAFPRKGFPLLSANLNLDAPEVQGLKNYIHPYTVKKIGRTKVGVFGMTTPAANILSQPSPAYIDDRVLEIAGQMVQTLKGEGCQVVICLSHLGIAIDRAVAQYIPGINVIIGGHDHLRTETPETVTNVEGGTTWIVQANAFYLDIGEMKLKVKDGSVRLVEYNSIALDSSIPEAPLAKIAVRQLIKGIENTYGPVYTQQVGYVTSFFEEVAADPTGPGSKDTPIGNLVTDAFRAATGTEVAIEVGGSTAEPLYPGPIVPADLFRVVGYGFNTDNGLGYRIATFEMPGEALYAGLEFGVSAFEENDEFLAQVSGVRYSYDPEAPPFSRITGVEVNGEPLDPSRLYTVTANEFVPLFLDQLGIPYFNLNVQPATSEFQVLASYVANVQVLSPLVEGRIVSTPGAAQGPLAKNAGVQQEREGALPVEFALQQNYPNPFNPSTTIPFALAADGYASLKVYNLLGQEVATLVAGDQPAGRHQAVWNAAGSASGVYVVRLESGGSVAMKKLQLVK